MEDNTSTQRGRLNALAVYLDMSVRKLAQFCNLSTATVYHITDNSSFVMSERTASRICYQLEKQKGILVNRDWLLNGTGEMINKPLSAPYESNEEGSNVQMAAEEPAPYGDTDWKAKYLDLMERYIALQHEYTELLKNKQ